MKNFYSKIDSYYSKIKNCLILQSTDDYLYVSEGYSAVRFPKKVAYCALPKTLSRFIGFLSDDKAFRIDGKDQDPYEIKPILQNIIKGYADNGLNESIVDLRTKTLVRNENVDRYVNLFLDPTTKKVIAAQSVFYDVFSCETSESLYTIDAKNPDKAPITFDLYDVHVTCLILPFLINSDNFVINALKRGLKE